jgi:hypothetical protein
LVGRHDEEFEEPTVRMGEVPPVPNPVASLITATNLESAGKGNVKPNSFPLDTVRSNMTLLSSPCGMNPIGTKRRL